MTKDVLTKIARSDIEVVILDIDGTLKDLCEEHDYALINTLNEYYVGRKKQKLILTLNRLAMSMVKTGLISTNHSKQKILTILFSTLACVDYEKFVKSYFKNYKKEICLFEGVYDILESLSSNKMIYFATTNKQNYNLGKCGIPQSQIVYTTEKFKLSTYKHLIERLNVPNDKIVIVGDNICDDIISAKILGTKYLLVNNYNSKFKLIVSKVINRNLK